MAALKVFTGSLLGISILATIIGIVLIVLWKTNIVSSDEKDRAKYAGPGISLTVTGALFSIIMLVILILVINAEIKEWKEFKKFE